MSPSLFDSVLVILESQARNPLPEIKPETQLKELALDSLELMDFVFAVEDHFKLRIPESRLNPRQIDLTFGDVCEAIEGALQAEPQASPVE